MKKFILSCLILAGATLAASAQMSVIKDAKASFKPGTSFEAFEQAIAPALTNPETAQLAETWYTAGEMGVKNYDEYLKMWGLGQNFDKADMGHSIVKAYNYWMKAMPLDQMPDAKGKVKPKFTKKIVADLLAHHKDFNTAAAMLWEVQDFKGAYDAWTIYLDMIGDDATYGKAAPAMPVDSIINTVYFNRGLAAWQANMYKEAMASFDKAIELNYDDPMIYKYACEVARLDGNMEAQFNYAKAGFDKTGDADFMRVMINKYIEANDLPAAKKLIEDGLANAKTDKDRSVLYLLQGVLIENIDADASNGASGVAEIYKKAVELDPTNGAAYYNYGRILSNQASIMEDNYTGTNYNAWKVENVDPIYRQAAEMLEKAITLDSSVEDKSLALLRNIYYQLKDDANYQRVNNM